MDTGDDRPGAARRRELGQDVVLAAGIVGVVAGIVLPPLVDVSSTNLPWYASSAVSVAAAGVVRWRRPEHPLTGWFGVFAAAVVYGYVSQDLIVWGIDRSASGWFLAVATLGGTIVTAASVMAGVRLFGWFPDGRPHDALERYGVAVATAVLSVAWLPLFFTPTVAWPSFIEGDPVANPLAIPGAEVSTETARTMIGLSWAVILIALALLVRRYRRAQRPARKQMRWLLLPLVVSVLAFASDLVVATGHAASLAAVIVSAALSTALALGIIRPERVDADIVLRRTVVWGLVWLVIAVVQFGVAAALGVTVAHRSSVGWAVTMTAVAVFALQPARTRLERLANRWLFGIRADSGRTIAHLGESLAGTYDLDALLPQIATAIEDGLDVEWARVRLTPAEPVDGPAPALAVPIVLDGDELGVIECGPRRRGALDDRDEAVVATFARQAALAVRNVRLTTQLRDRTAELASSRARLVRAQEEERHRIERDIHDGVQQNLVALILQAGLIGQKLDGDDPAGGGPSGEAGDVRAQVDELRDGLQRLLSELRDLATGIHPSVLRDRGLLVAVETLAARHPVPVRLRADPELRDLRLPIEIEGAGYFTVAESLANSLKYAHAGQLDISLSRTNGSTTIRVADDGVGFEPRAAAGNGLANLAARIAAVEGTLDVASRPGHGTTITAHLPITATFDGRSAT
jgi:signal transduction histidine kinase